MHDKAAAAEYDPAKSDRDLLSRLPHELVESLSPHQRAALWRALRQPSWRRHPVNIRLAVPWFGRRYFVTLVAGADRRGGDRHLRERVLHPLRTLGNVGFVLTLFALFYGAALTLLFIFSALVEF